MPRETNAAKRERAIEVCERLDRRYGPVECFLDHENPFRLVISVLLSAQTTDAQVNKVTPELFRRWPTPEAMAGATPAEIAEVIKSLGFYKTKAKHCVEAAQMIVADYGGHVPADMKELVKLPGVGRKTANIVLNVSFGIVEGIAVDTHVNRIAHRLKLSPKTHEKEPLKTEQDLLKILPKAYWRNVNHQWIKFGREICDARKPLCGECPLSDICPSVRC
ncbi:endonuclease III [Enorma massiliensis]|uniref:endonuclease III n=1 Tax=Enorma massiliensis TaxID=1472761 RepID=UPI0008208C6F|nr:endonuclease III [Enorma massiliensis]MBM6783834.1 endonuclease III [Enorma massiliensis]MBM6892578.1 endonuclease III [Enorma massiliensis]SCH76044.1 UV-endonuclease [uncultured Collinsella sp.]